MKQRSVLAVITAAVLFALSLLPAAAAINAEKHTLSLLEFASQVNKLEKNFDEELIPDRSVAVKRAGNTVSSKGGSGKTAETVTPEKLREMQNEGYSVFEGEDSATVSKPYQTCRLIVKGNAPKRIPGEKARVSGYAGLTVLQFETEEQTKAAENLLSETAGVEYAVPDGVVSTCETRSSHLSWGYESGQIGADTLLEYMDAAGSLCDVTVAVIDTGAMLDHPFLQNRVRTDIDYDFVNDDSDANDDHFHGTHVSGIIVDGTPENVKILPLKVLNANGSGTDLNVCLAVEYAVEHGADVINLSLGGSGYSELYEDVINAAVDAGTVVCIAAGNSQNNAASMSPANVESAITVGATKQNKARASFSNFGEIVDIAAPGENIVSSVPPEMAEGQEYKALSGTSMATPHVSAVSACLKSLFRELTCEAVLRIMQNTAIPLNTDVPVGDLVCAANIPSSGYLDLSLGTLEKELYPGQTFTLPVASSQPVTFTSSDPYVVSVSAAGELTALSLGNAVITADNGVRTETCGVSVTPITITPTYPEVDAYLPLQDKINYTCSHGLPVTFSSDNTAVAAVTEDGVLQPVSLGTATITLKAAEGTQNETTAEVHVTVRDIGSWYSPDETEYTITNTRELYEFSVLCNYYGESFEGKTVTIDDGIPELDMSGYRWLPVCSPRITQTTRFSGVFNGNRVPIKNLTCLFTESDIDGEMVYGLFAMAQNAEIRGVYLENVHIKAQAYAGGICGTAKGCLIDDCRVSGVISTVTEDAGGIVANADNCAISNCVNYANVSAGSLYAGGISASGFNMSSYLNCLNLGRIGGQIAGGISGTTCNGMAMIISYSALEAGQQQSPLDHEDLCVVANCVNYGRVQSSMVNQSVGTLFDNCWRRNGVSDYDVRRHNDSSEMPDKVKHPDIKGYNDQLITDGGESLIYTLNVSAFMLNTIEGDLCFLWTEENGAPMLTDGLFETQETYIWFDSNEKTMIEGETFTLQAHTNHASALSWTSSDESVAVVSSNGTITALATGEATVSVSNGIKTASIKITVIELGSWYSRASSVVHITTAEEMREFALVVNSGIDNFAGKTVYLDNDIDISAYADWEPVSYSNAPSHFQGCFNGQNNTVSGLSFTGMEAPQYGIFGLFGVIGSGAVIENLKLANVEIAQDRTYDAASVCGRVLSGAAVINCETVSGQLTNFSRLSSSFGTSRFSGIAAINDGTVKNCVNRLHIHSESVYCSGIVCSNYGVVDRCTNYGNIDGNFRLAGISIINDNGVIANCANYGNISDNSGFSGMYIHIAGICLNGTGKIYNCLNAGDLTASNHIRDAHVSGIIGIRDSFISGFYLGRCINWGTISAPQNKLALGKMYYARWDDVFWLDTSCEEGYIQEGVCTVSDVTTIDSNLNTSFGWNVIDLLNSYTVNFNHYYSDERAPAGSWTVDELGRPALADPCTHPSTTTRVITYPGCFDEGEELVCCSVCGASLGITRPIPAEGHRFYQVRRIEPTCVENGILEERCPRCGENNITVLPATGIHKDDDRDGYCDVCNTYVGQSQTDPGSSGSNGCPLCGETHTGFPGVLIGFFHRIIYFFKNLF